MKKIKFLLFSLMTLGMYAQSPMTISTNFTVDYGDRRKEEMVLFEPDNYNTDVTEIPGVWTAGKTEDKATYKVIVNPAQGGINKSAKCLEVTCRNNDGSIGIDFQTLLGNLPNLNGRRRISMLFKAGKNGETPLGNNYYSQMQLETNYDGDGKQVYCLGAYYDALDNGEAGHDGWKRLYFDFSPYNTIDNTYAPGYHTKVIGDYPSQLVFKPKICRVTIAADNRTITWHEAHTCSAGDVYYIDDIKIEDVPYAEGYWINDDTNLPKGVLEGGNWNTSGCALPKSESNGVLHLSGTWLKGENLVNPEIWEKEVIGSPWVYEFNEYRDLSWHVKPEDVKLMVFKDDSKLRWPDRGALLGTNTPADVTAGYPARFINNLNVLIFAEKSCVLPDEVDNLDAHWHDINAVVHYSEDTWKAWELEMTDAYPFLNPQEFTVENKIKCHRRMENGFNTLIYPFYLTPEELCSSRVGTIYHHKDSEKLYFVPRDQTEPNVPYLTENFTSTFEEGVKNVTNDYQEFPAQRTVSMVDSEWTYINTAETGALHGTYKTISGTNLWGIATQKDSSGNITWQGFIKGGTSAKFKPFRAYLDFPADAAPSRLSIFYDETLGISPECASFEPEAIESIYDLQGRAVIVQSIATLQKGIYIINGKKTFIK